MDREKLTRLFDLSTTHLNLQKFLVCVVPTLLAVLLFNYLHSLSASSFMHSLPVNRKSLYFSHSFAGAVLLALPILFTVLILIVLNGLTTLNRYYSIPDIFLWAGYILVFDMLFFLITVFAGMFTGSPISHLVLACLLQILPSSIYELVKSNLSYLLYGYSHLRINHGNQFDFYPLSMILSGRFSWKYYGLSHLLWYIILALILFAASMHIYQNRKLESAGDIIAFKKARPVLKYGVTIFSTLLTGAYLAYISGGSYTAIAFGYIFGSLLAYWAMEMLMQKSLKVWNAYKGYLVFLLLIFAALAIVKTDATGYVRRLPAPEQVQEVYFGTNFGVWIDPVYRQYYSKSPLIDTFDSFFFKEEESIKNLINLHGRLIQAGSGKSGQERHIIYTLKNGKRIMRSYKIDYRMFL